MLVDLVEVTRSDGLVLVTVREEYFKENNFKEVCEQLEMSSKVIIENKRWDDYVSYDRALYLALDVQGYFIAFAAGISE